MAKYTLANTKESYDAAWDNMEIKPEILPKAQSVADKIIGLKDNYLPLEDATGVPWYFIGLLHMRESNFDFETHLHNGDPLNKNGRYKRTTHVPANRPAALPENGKTYTFEESAIDALTYEFGKVDDWSIAQIAYFQEKYNGFGYRVKGKPSPYLWSGSNQYQRGKYIRDGVYDPTVADSQLGVMVVLKCILDKIELIPVVKNKEEVQPAPISPSADIERPSSSQMREQSRKFNAMEWMQWTIGAGGPLSIMATVATSTPTIWTVAVIILLCAIVFGLTVWIKKLMKDDVEEGRAIPSKSNQND